MDHPKCTHCFYTDGRDTAKRIQMLKALRRAQQNEIDTNTQYTNLIDNMPILYMKEQVIWDKEGNIIDSIYRDVNRYFERCFLPKSDIIGKRASEIFPSPCRNSPIS